MADNIAEDAMVRLSISQTNFPVPRELRDLIYDYLLGGERVTMPENGGEITASARSHSAAHRWVPFCCFGLLRRLSHRMTSLISDGRYIFHSNVLLINKTISAEATKHLYTSNRSANCAHQLLLKEKANRSFQICSYHLSVARSRLYHTPIRRTDH